VLAPVYAAGGRLACVALLALAGAALTVQVRALARRVVGDERALFAWAAAAGPPVAFYSFHVYTEVPSALALAVGIERLLRAAEGDGGRRQVREAAVAALLFSALPWLHVKMAAPAAGLGVLALCWLRGPARLAFAAVAAALAAGYAAFFAGVWGLVSPLALYGGTAPGVGPRRPLLALAGLLLDRSFGLLPHAPVFLLALAGTAGLVAAGRRSRAALALGLSAVLVVAPVLAWRLWWGGQCPPARFLVPAVPALAAAAALLPPRGLWRWRRPLAGAGVALGLFMAADPGRLLMLNRGDRPTRVWTALSVGGDLNAYLPSLVTPDARDLRVALIWLAALAVLLALHALAMRKPPVDRAFRNPLLPGVWLAALVGLIYLLAPPPNTKEPAEDVSVARRALPGPHGI
jgi:hypothetical protein